MRGEREKRREKFSKVVPASKKEEDKRKGARLHISLLSSRRQMATDGNRKTGGWPSI